MTTDTIEESVDDTAPPFVERRRAGRPRKYASDEERREANNERRRERVANDPEYRAREQRRKNASKPRKSAGDIARGVHGIVNIGNLIASQTRYAEDCLTPDEASELSEAIAEEVNANPVLMRWMNRASTVLPHVRIINTLGMILYVRLVRHGKVPNVFAAENASVPLEARGTYGGGGGYGDGQINANGYAFPGPVVSDNGADETR